MRGNLQSLDHRVKRNLGDRALLNRGYPLKFRRQVLTRYQEHYPDWPNLGGREAAARWVANDGRDTALVVACGAMAAAPEA